MVIGGVKLDLKKVTIPIFNLATREDHIAPARSVFLGSKAFGGPVDYVLAGSGHIAGVVNPVSKPKYQFWTGGPVEGELEDWIAKATEHPGTWWPYWFEWIGARPEDGPGPRARRRQAEAPLRRARHLRHRAVLSAAAPRPAHSRKHGELRGDPPPRSSGCRPARGNPSGPSRPPA